MKNGLTAVSSRWRNGAYLIIQDLLGHKSARKTQIYTQVT